jgi:hypothetical protein
MPDVNVLKSIIRLRNQSVLVALDVEYGPFVHYICIVERFSDVG